MNEELPFLITDPEELASLGFWTAEVYADLQALDQGIMQIEAFEKKYTSEAAILCLDLTGFTNASLEKSMEYSFLTIMKVHQLCYPIFQKHQVLRVRAFADNFTAIFERPMEAFLCAMDIHHRLAVYHDDFIDRGCIGLGFGRVFRIGLDKAMGREMNQTSKLGEDVARGGETLVTQGFYKAVQGCAGYIFEAAQHEELSFGFYKVIAQS